MATPTPQTQPQVRVGVGVFVLSLSPPGNTSSPNPDLTSNPYFLLGKRLSSHGAGRHALPGGHLEFGETPEECAAREVLEETGLRIKASSVRFLTATNDFMEKEGKHYVTLFMVCVREDEMQEPRTMEKDKCEGWSWVCWDALRNWVKQEELAEGLDFGVVTHKVFLPLKNLIRQREGVVPCLL